MTAEFVGERPTKRTFGYRGAVATWDRLHDAAPDDWTIFHEPYLSKGTSGLAQRTPDFVIVAPPHGTVVLEVKGHNGSDVVVENRSIWVKYSHEQRKDALAQARSQAQKLRNEISSDQQARVRFNERRMNLGTSVGFPFWGLSGSTGHTLRLSPQGWETWELVETSAYESGESLVRRIEQLLKDHARAYQCPEFPIEESRAFVSWFKGVSHAGRTNFGPLLQSFAKDLDDYTAEELAAYAEAAEADRYWLDSPMGTGKTWIAKNRALHSAYRGKRVAFLMERAAIARDLRAELSKAIKAGGLPIRVTRPLAHTDPSDEWESPESGPEIMVGTVTGALMRWDPDLLKKPDIERTAYKVLEAREKGKFNLYDLLLLDQAEDFLLQNPNLLVALGELVVGGLEQGKIKVFSDIKYQGRQDAARDAALRKYLSERGFLSARPLETNCRNPESTARYLNKLLAEGPHSAPVYTAYMNTDDESEFLRPEVRGFTATSWFVQGAYPEPLPPSREEVQELANELRRLQDAGVTPGDVVVLTAMSRTGSENHLSAEWSSPKLLSQGKWEWSPRYNYPEDPVKYGPHVLDLKGLGAEWLPQSGRDNLRSGSRLGKGPEWFTVEEYRGGEASIVILTDLDRGFSAGPQLRALVGAVSRNKARVVIISNLLRSEWRPDRATKAGMTSA
jgi:hypothetical protein